MGLLRWLYRLPGRFNRWSGPAAAAAAVEDTGMGGGPTVNAAGVKLTLDEIEKAEEEEQQ